MSDNIEISVPIPTDEDGMLGRECLECEEYFKIKPGCCQSRTVSGLTIDRWLIALFDREFSRAKVNFSDFENISLRL